MPRSTLRPGNWKTVSKPNALRRIFFSSLIHYRRNYRRKVYENTRVGVTVDRRYYGPSAENMSRPGIVIGETRSSVDRYTRVAARRFRAFRFVTDFPNVAAYSVNVRFFSVPRDFTSFNYRRPDQSFVRPTVLLYPCAPLFRNSYTVA